MLVENGLRVEFLGGAIWRTPEGQPACPAPSLMTAGSAVAGWAGPPPGYLTRAGRSTAADADSTARCMPSPTRNVQCPAIFR